MFLTLKLNGFIVKTRCNRSNIYLFSFLGLIKYAKLHIILVQNKKSNNTVEHQMIFHLLIKMIKEIHGIGKKNE